MATRTLPCRLALSLALVLLTTPLIHAQLTGPGSGAGGGRAAPGAREPITGISPTFSVQNAFAVLDFTTSGTSLELLSVMKRPAGTPIDMDAGSGSWSLRFMLPGTGAEQWFDVRMDGTTLDLTGGQATLDALSLDGAMLSQNSSRLDASWSGTVTILGVTTDFSVDTVWEMEPGQPVAGTTLSVTLENPAALPFYLTHVTYPKVMALAYAGPNDKLVVPYKSGSLISQPTRNTFADWLDTTEKFLSLQCAGYYDGDDPGQRCLYYAASDDGDHWKDFNLFTKDDVGLIPGHVGFDVRHLMPDAPSVKSWSTPYEIRVGALAGDWWDVAETHQRFLVSDGIPWYHGPVGSSDPGNPIPLPTRQFVAEVIYQPGVQGDHMDIIARQMMDMTRVLGSRVFTIWYGAHAPDTFDHWYYEGGYLPGRPSMRAAFLEGQKQFGHVVAPYVQGSTGADHTDPAMPPDNPSQQVQQLREDVHDAFLIEEDGGVKLFPSPLGPPRSGMLCPGSLFWRGDNGTSGFFVDNIRDIAAFSGMKGVYLDFFLTGPCWSTEHDHAPGGGNWMWRDRMTQVAKLKQEVAALPVPQPQFTVAMEISLGRMSEEVHFMHTNPAGALMSVINPGKSAAVPMPNAVAIPLFRAVHDNVKMGRITTKVPADTGRRVWVEANNVFTFGQVPAITRPLLEQIPIFSQRFAYAAGFNALDPDLNGFDGDIPTGGGDPDAGGNPDDDNDSGGGEVPPGDGEEGSTVNIFAPPDVLNIPYFTFLRDLAGVLREQNLLLWHNGTIRRIPAWTITNVVPPGFAGIPGVELDPTLPQTNTPVYVEELLVPGMFQAPFDAPSPDGGSLAFVLANPWVGEEQATITADFVFVPQRYPQWSNSSSYTVTADGNDIPPSLLGGPQCGNFSGTLTLAPGDIRWFIFRQTGGVCPP